MALEHSGASASILRGAHHRRAIVEYAGAKRKPSTLDTTAFTLYIDPSGTVVDGATQLPVPGAIVTMLRSSSAHGTFAPVPNGDAIMALSNRNNPDLTNAYGDYGWDVIPGFYKLRVSAPGCICNTNTSQSLACADDATVETPVFAIPPAVTGLTITIFRDEVFAGNFEGGP